MKLNPLDEPSDLIARSSAEDGGSQHLLLLAAPARGGEPAVAERAPATAIA